MLHGSMKDHYNKLGRYLEDLKIASPETFLSLVKNPYKKTFPPVFHRLFVCFDQLKNVVRRLSEDHVTPLPLTTRSEGKRHRAKTCSPDFLALFRTMSSIDS